MTIKSKLLKHLSGTDFEPYYWHELLEHEQETAKRVASTYVAVTALFSIATAVAIDEIRNTPEGCTAVLFPEQTFLQQPEHCKRNYNKRPLFGLGFGTSGTLTPTR
ncbi:MAG: hypothetical protein AAF244_02400 [Pseudomonadota bacterium]